MRRYLATFFRGRWAYLPIFALLVLASVVGTAWLGRQQLYEATARLWVDTPILAALGGQSTTSYPAPPPPAQQQSDSLAQLLGSNAFIASILQASPEARQLSPNPESDPVLIERIRGHLVVTQPGPNTMIITFSDRDPQLTEQVVTNTIDQLMAWNVKQAADERAAETQYYQRQLSVYDTQVTALRKNISDVQAQFPNLTTSANPNAAAPQVIELERLQRELETAQGHYTDTKTKLDALQDENSHNDQQVAQMRVIDRPVATAPTRTKSMIAALTYLVLGILASLVIIIAAAVVNTWRDRSVRTLDDLARFYDGPVLEVIPHLPQRRSRGRRGQTSQASGDATRGRREHRVGAAVAQPVGREER